MLSLLGGIFLGWSLGANDASNAFGSAVSSRMVKFWTAAVLAALFVVLGAILEGRAGIETLQGLTGLTLKMAVVSSVAAAVTVTIMTLLGLPVSTSQAAVGAILGIGFLNKQLNVAGLGKVVACWFGTPIGGLLIAMVLYRLLAVLFNRSRIDIFKSDILLRLALIVAGSYAAYALGANNVANVTAVFVGAGQLTVGNGGKKAGASGSFFGPRGRPGRRPYGSFLYICRGSGFDVPGGDRGRVGRGSRQRDQHGQPANAKQHFDRMVTDTGNCLFHRCCTLFCG
jgi:PiT family inorganic phosphate transporter